MADEKTNPTPKVEGARTDTMHSTPQTPDRSKLSADQLAKEDTAPPSNAGTVGSEKPGRSVVGSAKPNKNPDQPAGTLVTDIPSLDEGEEKESNVPNPAPEGPLAVQPTEDPLRTDTSKEFGNREAKTSRKAGASGKAKSSSKSSTAKASASKSDSAKDKS